jgi:hypothetical protein
MVSDDKQYEFFTRRLTDLSNATQDGLKLFVPTFSAIVGGAIWLRMQSDGAALPTYEILSNWVVVLLTVVCIALVLYNLWIWRRVWTHVVRITRESNYPLSLPPWSVSAIDIALCAAIAAACILFILYNPFGVSA